jgi:hypothetical protein
MNACNVISPPRFCLVMSVYPAEGHGVHAADDRMPGSSMDLKELRKSLDAAMSKKKADTLVKMRGGNKNYLIIGWNYQPDGSEVMGFVVPNSKTPRDDIQRALRKGCRMVSVLLLHGGNLNESEKFVGDRLALSRRAQSDDLPSILKSVSSPSTKSSNIAYRVPPKVPVWNGPTICNVVGFLRKSDGSLTFIWGKDGSVNPGDDVERALDSGSNNVEIEVMKWGTRPRKP